MDIGNFAQLREHVFARPGETVAITVKRGEEVMVFDVRVDTVQRLSAETGEPVDAGAIGMGLAPVPDAMKRFGPVEAIPATLRYAGEMLGATFEGLLAFPGKIPGVVASLFGAERDVEGPVSVIGASRTGGELAANSMWPVFFMMLASLNFFLAVFNLVPLPPLDGGHIAVIFYEKIRDFVRRLRGLPPGPPANYEKLLPLTYIMASFLLLVGVVVMLADVINPIRLFG